MFKHLDGIEKRFRELQDLLAEPDAGTDMARYRRLATEFSALKPIVETYEALKKIREEIQKVKELFNEKAGEEDEFNELAQEELKHLQTEEENCVERLQELLLKEEDESSRKNVIMEIRAGTGGEEAAIFVSDLYRMYMKYAAERKWQAEIMSSHPASAGGFKEIIFSVQGGDVYSYLKYESGTHRVQRVPVTETSGRIHTSAATVAVLPEAEEIDLKIEQSDLKVDVYRSSGPGGQGVNTTDSAVRITHISTGMIVTCQDERSQLKNKIKAMRVLRTRLLDQLKKEEQAKISRDRRRQIGSGDRSEKIRTYNFPDRRITDHRIGLVLYKLDRIMSGELDEVITALQQAEKKLRLEGIKNGDLSD